MIDTKELRRLAQAATPGPWINHGRQPNVAGLPHSAVAAKTLLARVYSEAYGDVEQETANASFIAAANPAAVSELLDRLEAAEAEALEEARLNGMGSEREAKHLAQTALMKQKYDDLRAKIEAMERQEPVGEIQRANSTGNYICSEVWVPLPVGSKLYALPGAQPAPSAPDGWKLVPMVSTYEMDMAGSSHCDGYLSTAQMVWDAMLAAAPEKVEQ